jgi:topoisomerase-4 subunit A
MSGEEKIVSAIVIQDFAQNHQQVLVTTKMGAIKRVPIKDFETKLFSKPFRLIKLTRPSDEVVSADLVTAKTHNVVVVNEKGYGVRYDINDIPVQGLGSKGVKASSVIDPIVGGHAFDLDQDLIVLTKKNHIKRIGQSDIPVFVRPKKGTRLFVDTSKKTPDVVKFSFAVSDESTLHFLNEDNEVNDLAAKKVKATALDKKPHALDFGNLVDASLGTGFRGNSTDRLSHETEEPESDNQDDVTVNVAPKVKTSQANMSFDFKDDAAKKAIDQKYDNSMYSMFDDLIAPNKNQESVEEPTSTVDLQDPRKKDA